MDIFNKAFQDVTGYLGVKMEFYQGINHYVFFDNKEVNKRINHIYTPNDIKELIKDLDWEISQLESLISLW